MVLSQHEGGECLNDTVHIAKDKVLRLVINQKAPTPQAISTWLRHLGKNNQGVKALQKVNKTLLNLQKEVYTIFKNKRYKYGKIISF